MSKKELDQSEYLFPEELDPAIVKAYDNDRDRTAVDFQRPGYVARHVKNSNVGIRKADGWVEDPKQESHLPGHTLMWQHRDIWNIKKRKLEELSRAMEGKVQDLPEESQYSGFGLKKLREYDIQEEEILYKK